MNEKMIELGQRVVRCKHWKWSKGLDVVRIYNRENVFQLSGKAPQDIYENIGSVIRVEMDKVFVARLNNFELDVSDFPKIQTGCCEYVPDMDSKTTTDYLRELVRRVRNLRLVEVIKTGVGFSIVRGEKIRDEEDLEKLSNAVDIETLVSNSPSVKMLSVGKTEVEALVCALETCS